MYIRKIYLHLYPILKQKVMKNVITLGLVAFGLSFGMIAQEAPKTEKVGAKKECCKTKENGKKAKCCKTKTQKKEGKKSCCSTKKK